MDDYRIRSVSGSGGGMPPPPPGPMGTPKMTPRGIPGGGGFGGIPPPPGPGPSNFTGFMGYAGIGGGGGGGIPPAPANYGTLGSTYSGAGPANFYDARGAGSDRSPSPTGAGILPIGASPLDLQIDFTRPDAQRTRPLIIDGRKLYVDEHYISVWSPVLRQWCVECPDRELIFANVSYDHVLEMMQAIHPTYKDVDDQTVQHLLPLAFDYQMEGLLHRCECFLIATKMPFLEKVWLADRYQLNRLLTLLLRELNPQKAANRLDLGSAGSRYQQLSDRVKVLLLERMHGAPAPEELPEPPIDMDTFANPTDLQFAAIRAKTGRSYYVNPYYVSAWSAVFADRLTASAVPPVTSALDAGDPIYCPVSHDELRYFLQAIHPPQLRITEQNVAPVLMAASKMESAGLLRKCAQLLLNPQTQLSVFVRLSLLDRCRLHELLEQCLAMVYRPQDIVDMSQQQTYECLTIRARSTMMDRMAQLVKQQGAGGTFLQPHLCTRCKQLSGCADVTWMCPACKTYTEKQAPQAMPGGPFSNAAPGQQQASPMATAKGRRQTVIVGTGGGSERSTSSPPQAASYQHQILQQQQVGTGASERVTTISRPSAT